MRGMRTRAQRKKRGLGQCGCLCLTLYVVLLFVGVVMLFSARAYYAQLVGTTCYLAANATTAVWFETACRSSGGDSYDPCWSASIGFLFNVSVPAEDDSGVA